MTNDRQILVLSKLSNYYCTIIVRSYCCMIFLQFQILLIFFLKLQLNRRWLWEKSSPGLTNPKAPKSGKLQWLLWYRCFAWTPIISPWFCIDCPRWISQIGLRLAQIGLNLSKLDHIGLKSSKFVWNNAWTPIISPWFCIDCPSWITHIGLFIRLKLSKLVMNCPYWSYIVHIGLNLPKLVIVLLECQYFFHDFASIT